jgi:hypothetical protein
MGRHPQSLTSMSKAPVSGKGLSCPWGTRPEAGRVKAPGMERQRSSILPSPHPTGALCSAITRNLIYISSKPTPETTAILQCLHVTRQISPTKSGASCATGNVSEVSSSSPPPPRLFSLLPVSSLKSLKSLFTVFFYTHASSELIIRLRGLVKFNCEFFLARIVHRLGMVAPACNPCTQEAEIGGS